MKKLTKTCALTLSLALLLALSACGGQTSTGSGTPADAASVDKVTISVASTVADGNPMMDLIYYFQEQVDAKLPGRVQWDTYPNSVMGAEREIGEMCVDGTVDAALIGISNYAAFVPVKSCRLQEVPFLFKDQDELYDASDEWFADMLNEECEPHGFTTIFTEYIMGQEIENTRRPIYTPEDVAGLKIRVYDSVGPYKFLEACGGLPVAMPMSELYTSLEQGTIDGSYTTTSNFPTQKLTEVMSYHTKMTITNVGMGLIFNLDKLNSLPQDLQDALHEAGMETEKYCRETLSPTVKERVYDEIAAAGVEVNEVAPDQYQRFVDITAEYCYDELREEIGPSWDYCVEWLENYRANK